MCEADVRCHDVERWTTITWRARFLPSMAYQSCNGCTLAVACAEQQPSGLEVWVVDLFGAAI